MIAAKISLMYFESICELKIPPMTPPKIAGNIIYGKGIDVVSPDAAYKKYDTTLTGIIAACELK